MKIARHPSGLASTRLNGTAPRNFPAPSLRELARPSGVTEGVSSDEWWNVKTFEFRRGDENRPPPLRFSEYPVEWERFPAPSLRELARPKGVTEGVSSDGSSRPMDYEPAHIGSEIFERLRSSKYTPSVSLRSTAPSGREPGGGAYHSTYRPGTARFRAIFIAPTKLRGGDIPAFKKWA